MAKIKILGKTKLVGGSKLVSPAPLSFSEFSVWTFNAPPETSNINNFSVGFDSGSVLGDWGSGYQTLQSNQIKSITI
jgi:hypothetical protein